MADIVPSVEAMVDTFLPEQGNSQGSHKRLRGLNHGVNLMDDSSSSDLEEEARAIRQRLLDPSSAVGAGLTGPYSDCPLAVYPVQPPENAPASVILAPAPQSTIPDTAAMIQFLRRFIVEDPTFIAADTVVIITDTKPFTGYEHWPYTARLLYQRTQISHKEIWNMIAIQMNNDNSLDKPHYTWGAVFILEVLVLWFPAKNFIMLDHDAAFTCAWEIHQLSAFILQHKKDITKIGMILVNEVHSRVNAGMVIMLASQEKPRQGDLSDEQVFSLVVASRHGLIEREQAEVEAESLAPFCKQWE